MKLQIIETPDYILAVSDEEPKEGDWVLLPDNTLGKIGGIKENGQAFTDGTKGSTFTSHLHISKYKKIIAYQPKGNAPELDLPLLPEMVVEDDVEKLAKETTKKYINEREKQTAYLEFIEGHKSATKVYSKEDLRKALKMLYNSFKKGYVAELDVDFQEEDEIIQSLKQPKTPKWFVAETITLNCFEDCMTKECQEHCGRTLKTTTINGKAYLVGTYLNE
jgi:hypothetical protein